MTKVVIGTIQQQVKIYKSPLEYQEEIFSFLEMAQAQQVQLVILPALSPLMLIPPLFSSTKLNLLKRGKQSKTILPKFVSKLVDKALSTASEVIGGLKEDLIYSLQNYPDEIYDAYIDLFSAAALKYNMTIVAGSFYLREYEEAEPTHTSYVFGPRGMILGQQKKTHLTFQEQEFCTHGKTLQVIETTVGKIGVLINEDVLYPECARVLAYQGADILISLITASGVSTYQQMRHAFLSRVDENEVFGIQSALVGSNLLQPAEKDWVGKSAFLQPIPLSKRGDGIIFETATTNYQGVIVETINLEDLKDYWARPQPSLRRRMQTEAYIPLAKIYYNQKTLDQLYWNPQDELTKNFNVDDLNQHGFNMDTTTETASSASEAESEANFGLLQSPFADDDLDDEA